MQPSTAGASGWPEATPPWFQSKTSHMALFPHMWTHRIHRATAWGLWTSMLNVEVAYDSQGQGKRSTCTADSLCLKVLAHLLWCTVERSSKWEAPGCLLSDLAALLLCVRACVRQSLTSTGEVGQKQRASHLCKPVGAFDNASKTSLAKGLSRS